MNDSSYRGFYQTALNMSSNNLFQDQSYNRNDSSVQASYYSVGDQPYQSQNTNPAHQMFGQDFNSHNDNQTYYNSFLQADYNSQSAKSSQESHGYYQDGVTQSSYHYDQQAANGSGANTSHQTESIQNEAVFGIDFNVEQQKKQWDQFQQIFQETFEQQLTHQIHLQLQKYGSTFQRTGNLGDEVAVYFGDDNVGKRKGDAVYGGNRQRDDERMTRYGDGHSRVTNSSSRSSDQPGHRSRTSKFYCSTCDVSYANSLAFTGHLGSMDHKLKMDRRPKPILQPSLSSSTTHHQISPSNGEIPCHLCNILCAGTDVYAEHITSEEHQRILKMNGDNRKKDRLPASSSMPLPEDFGVNFDNVRGDVHEDLIGQEFIEEIRNKFGNIIRVYCGLCRFEISSPKAKFAHLKSQQHKILCERMATNRVPVFGQNLNGATSTQSELPGPSSSHGRGIYPPMFGTPLFGQSLDQASLRRMSTAPTFGTDFARKDTLGRSGEFGEPGENQDDECVRQKHSLIYPTSEDLRAVQRVSGSCDRWLKTTMNNCMDEFKQKLISAVLKVGSLAKGLLLRHDLSCDFLVLTRDWPTKTFIKTIYEKLEILKEKNTKDDQSEFVLKISDSGDSIVLENLWQPFVKCTVHFSSDLIREETEEPIVADIDRLDRDECLRHINQLEHSKWFKVKANLLPSCVLVVRVFKDIKENNTEFQCLTDEAIESLVAMTIADLNSVGGPGTILKKTLERLSLCQQSPDVEGDGAKAGTLMNIHKLKMWHKAKDDDITDEQKMIEYLSCLTSQEKDGIIKLSKNLLCEISQGNMKEVLRISSRPESDEARTNLKHELQVEGSSKDDENIGDQPPTKRVKETDGLK